MMTGSKSLNVIIVATLLGALSGCGEKTKAINAPRQNAEAGKNDQLPLDAKKPATAEELLGKDAAFLDADYKFDITSLFGIGVCKGDIGLKLNANMGKEATAALFEIPKDKGVIDCGFLGGKVNLADMIGAFAKEGQGEMVKDPIVVKNDVISLKQLGFGTYSPPRPLLPSFIASKKDDLASLNFSETVTMTNKKDGTTSSGNITVRTIGIDQSYKPLRMQRQFNKVLHFEVTNQGFQNADKISNLLFDRMEFKISLDPLAILYVEFKGKVADAMKALNGNGAAGGAGAGGAAGGLGGLASGPLIGALTKVIDVKLKLDLISMKGLEDSNTMAEEGEDEVGEEIGGKKSDDEEDSEDDEE